MIKDIMQQNVTVNLINILLVKYVFVETEKKKIKTELIQKFYFQLYVPTEPEKKIKLLLI